MQSIAIDFIRNDFPETDKIFKRGENIFSLGGYALIDCDEETYTYNYKVGGNYGDYSVSIEKKNGTWNATCSCPYPYKGCKHAVACLLDIQQRLKRKKIVLENEEFPTEEYLTPEEIRRLALSARVEKAKKEKLTFIQGESFKGEHIVRNKNSREYTVTIYKADGESGHCSCPDFAYNHLSTCKHLIFAHSMLHKNKKLEEQGRSEVFPFVHFTWNARLQKPYCYFDHIPDDELKELVGTFFNENGIYTRTDLSHLYHLFYKFEDAPFTRFDGRLIDKINEYWLEREIKKIKSNYKMDLSFLKASLYPYQETGVMFSLFRKAAIIADEMGLGKTLQAICVAILKKQLFGFTKILIISPSSLKEQWQREIEKFTDEQSVIVSGNQMQRKKTYFTGEPLFRITNYEAVLRDVLTIRKFNPDFIILDEAQRIKNFETKTHRAILSIPKKHSLVITGTPIENKLEDLYSISQFSEIELFTPLWAFASRHFCLDRKKKDRVHGYKNLETIHEKAKDLILRRKKEEVFDCLPEQITNNYYVNLTEEQSGIQASCLQGVAFILAKKIITPMDYNKIQSLLQTARRACNSTYLVDRTTNISTKLPELKKIINDLVIQNNRKVIIFTEWTSMTYLVGKMLSEMGIDFVEFSGKIPVKKRQLLIDEFQGNPDCKAFVSTDSGGVGLNLQNADCVINVELPWNPAKLNQRIGRVNRIGQKSKTVNVINLIAKASIEERILAGINMKQELFDSVLDGRNDAVDMSSERKNEFINEIRTMLDEIPDKPVGKQPENAELEDNTPHFLNPEVLKEPEIDIEAEVITEEEQEPQKSSSIDKERSSQMKSVLEQGMGFLNSLSKMSTGKDLFDPEKENSIEVDDETGEVVLRFKLPQ